MTVAPHVKGNKQILEQAISESYQDGPPPTAGASPGGIRDKQVRQVVQRKPALNELPDPNDGTYNTIAISVFHRLGWKGLAKIPHSLK